MSPVGWRQRDRLSRDQDGTSGRVECECLAAAVRAEDDEAARVLMLGIKLAAFPDFGQGVRGGTGATRLKPATSGVTVRASHNDDRRRSTTIACKSSHSLEVHGDTSALPWAARGTSGPGLGHVVFVRSRGWIVAY
jgi:hypothetical protein